MNKKTYNFSYGSTVKKVISKTVSLLYNTFAGCVLLLLFIFIMSRINYILKGFCSESVLDIIKRIEVYSGVLIVISFVIITFLPQKVEIYDKVIKIRRHCLFLNPFMIFRGFNDNIQLGKIEKVHRPENKDKFLKPIPVNVIDWENMVLIEVGVRTYYVPVENSEDFIEELINRVNDYRQKHNMESI